MKKLLIAVSAYVAFLLAPTAATPATIVEPFAVPFPFSAPILLNFGIQLLSTNIQQFNPALGTLNDVQLTLTGSFNWFPFLDSNPAHQLVVSSELGPTFTIFQTFDGVPVTDDTVPVSLNLMGTTTSPLTFNIVTGTSFFTDQVLLDLFSLSAFPDQVSAIGEPGDQLVSLQGTVTYDYTPAVSGVPEPSTWAMMLIGFAGLGFALRRSRHRLGLATTEGHSC
jgi:PEP-CTERM motif